MDTAGALRRLGAEIAIRTLIARYSDAVFRHDAEAYGVCFAAAGEWHAFGRIIRGREAIVAFWVEVMRQFPVAWQTVNTIVLEIDGDAALGRCYVQEILRLADGSARAAMGVYHDAFAVEDGRWTFASRRYDPVYIGVADYTAAFFDVPAYGAPPHDPDPARLTAPLSLD